MQKCTIIIMASLLCSLFTMKGNTVSPQNEKQTFTLKQSGAPTVWLSRTPAAQECQTTHTPVLYIHGATFPSELSIGFKIDGLSWRDDLNARCFPVWALDFAGYGFSDRYTPDNRAEYDTSTPPGRTPEAAAQIARAVNHIIATENIPKVSIIAHSWGSMPAGHYAAHFPQNIERLVMFGPVSKRNEPSGDQAPLSYTRLITPDAQHTRFLRETPAGHAPVLALTPFKIWGDAYLASDQESRARNPAAVAVPNGTIADVIAAWSGTFPYAPADIKSPTLIVRGEWDTVTTDADARWLYESLINATTKRDVKIDRSGHLMHLEDKRHDLYAVTANFLMEGEHRD